MTARQNSWMYYDYMKVASTIIHFYRMVPLNILQASGMFDVFDLILGDFNEWRLQCHVVGMLNVDMRCVVKYGNLKKSHANVVWDGVCFDTIWLHGEIPHKTAGRHGDRVLRRQALKPTNLPSLQNRDDKHRTQHNVAWQKCITSVGKAFLLVSFVIEAS